MLARTKPFWITWMALSVLIAVAGRFYVQQQNIPSRAAAALVPAAILEAGFYLATGFPAVIALLRRIPREYTAPALILSAVAPYLIFSALAGTLQVASLLVLAALAGVLSYWWLLFPRNIAADLGFLAFVAAVYLSRAFGPSFSLPLAADSLGRMAWLHTAILGALLIGRVEDPGLGFWPKAKEWRVGFYTLAAFLPVALVLGLALKFTTWAPKSGIAWKAVPMFLGMLWVVAYSEEFFFRGLLQTWFTRWLRSAVGGLIAASLLFGSVHLYFRQFPNWRFAAIAMVAGLFYGRAYQLTGSVRAPMVTHALINVIWRLGFN